MMNELSQTAILDRCFFTNDETEVILKRAHIELSSNKQGVVSAQDILDYVASSLRDTFFAIAYDHLEDASASALQ